MWARRLVQRMIDAEEDKGTDDSARQAPGVKSDLTVPPHQVNPDLPGRFEEPASLLDRGL